MVDIFLFISQVLYRLDRLFMFYEHLKLELDVISVVTLNFKCDAYKKNNPEKQ